ncbi:MAG: HAD-IIB family hydrolase [Myxococcota bacterium]
MKTLDQLPRQGLRGIVFDVDDTLTKDGRLQASAFDAMWRLRNAGWRLVAVTGRPLGWADVFARLWPVDLAVGENGAGWSWVAEHRFRTGYFEDEAARALSARRKLAALERVRREMPEVQDARDNVARRCDLALDVGEEASLSADEIRHLVALIEDEQCRAPVSSVHCHIVPGHWNKALGAERAIRGVLGEFQIDEWVFVGDSGNDAEAFAAFPASVGVANVRTHLELLRTPPRYVTDAAFGDGFAELADYLLEPR